MQTQTPTSAASTTTEPSRAPLGDEPASQGRFFYATPSILQPALDPQFAPDTIQHLSQPATHRRRDQERSASAGISQEQKRSRPDPLPE